MEIFVKVLTESLKTGEKKVCATAFLTFVALDENGKPVEVPGVIPLTEQEKDLYEGAELRRERRSERRAHSFKMANKFSEEIIKKNHQQLQEDFAELILKKGVNSQQDQAVMLRAPVEGAEFVRLLAKKAYELGAKNVHVNWADDTLTHLKFKHAKDDVLKTVP